MPDRTTQDYQGPSVAPRLQVAIDRLCRFEFQFTAPVFFAHSTLVNEVSFKAALHDALKDEDEIKSKRLKVTFLTRKSCLPSHHASIPFCFFS